MHKLYALLILFVISVSSSMAQQSICGFDATHNEKLRSNPSYRKSIELINAQIQDFIDHKVETINTIYNGSEIIYEIPVVIHVIHTGDTLGSPYNPDDIQLTNWIDFVNKVFATEASSFGYPNEANGGVKVPIRLKLAQKDPNCFPTTGITRHDLSNNPTYVTSGIYSSAFGIPQGVPESTIRNMTQWDVSKYYNIYVINKFNGNDGTTSGVFLAGYAYFPNLYSLLNNDDGSVMIASVAKAGNTTLLHEIGHAWGLYHTFEGQTELGNTCNIETNCITQGDLVCDTEPSQNLLLATPYPTSSSLNPCTGNLFQGVQNNIMNYGQNLNKFTLGQKDRMMAVIGTIRKNLAVSVTNINNGNIPFTTSNMPAVIYPTSNISNNGFLQGFTNITLNNLKYAGRPFEPGISNFYENYTNSCHAEYYTTLDSGAQYTLNYQIFDGPNNSIVKLQIDWNNNGIFETSETVSSTTVVSTNNQQQNVLNPLDRSITFNIPNTALLNTPVRMRLSHSLTPYNNSSIVNYSPQVLDFAVMVINPVATLMEVEAFSIKNESCNNEITYKVNRTEVSEAAQIEYSEDGSNFKTLTNISTFNVKGTFTHSNLNAEKYYYRIRLEGKEKKYSHIISQQNKCYEETVNVYPNPANNQITIYSPNNAIKNLSIFNMNGSILQQLNVMNQHKLDISLITLQAGTYIVEITTQDEKIIRKIISKI